MAAAPWRPLPSLTPASAWANGVGSHYTVANGAHLHAVTAGDGPPLVLLHALGWDHRQWERTIPLFRDRYQVIAVDARGHGLSDMAPGPYSLPLFRDDLGALLDSLRIERACLVGFSLGGMIAQYFAAEQPDRIAALVLVSTVCHTDPALRGVMEERIAANKARGPRAAAETVAKTLFSERFRNAEPEFLEQFYAWRVARDQNPIFESMRATFALDICDALPAFRMPTLVIAGDDDTATPRDTVAKLAERIPGAAFKSVAQSGHMIPIEQPDAFHRLLADFLARHYPA